MSAIMIHEGMLASGCFLVVIATWWLIQITKRFYSSRQHHYDFQSSVTFPCCERLKTQPVEGFLKIISSLAIAITLFCTKNDLTTGYSVYLSNTEFGTLFTFMLVSGVIDVLACWSRRSFYNGLDYIALMLFFAVEALILTSRSCVAGQPTATLYQLNIFSAIATIVVIATEMRYPDQVLCPLTRSYMVLIQGTWNLQLFYFFSCDGVSVSGDPGDQMMLLSMYFSWHCGADFLVVLLMWLLVSRLAHTQCCPCGDVDVRTGQEMVYLENRVRFDYHVMDRFESDID